MTKFTVERWVIIEDTHTPNEDALFWDNSWGWSDLNGATHFTEYTKGIMDLPENGKWLKMTITLEG